MTRPTSSSFSSNQKTIQETHLAAVAGLRTFISLYITAIAMIRSTSPAGEHGPVSGDLSPAGRISHAEDIFEGNTFHEQRTSRNRPCDACRRRKGRCVMNNGAVKCVLCEFHARECTFIEKIPPRKRRRTSCDDDLGRWFSPSHSSAA